MRCITEMELVADALPGRFRVRHLHWGGGSPIDAGARRLARADRRRSAGTSTSPPTPNWRSNSIPATPRKPTSPRSPRPASTAPRSACRISIPTCRRRSTASSPSHGRAGVRLAAPLRHRRRQHRPDLRAAAADRGEGAGDGRAGDAARAGAGRLVRLRPRAVDEEPSEADRRGGAAGAGGAVAAVLGGFAAAGRLGFAPSASTTSPAPTMRWRRRSTAAGCAATSRATPPTMRRSCSASGASAIGALPQGYVQNVAPLADYRRALEQGRLPPCAAWCSPPRTGCAATSSNG